LVRYAKFAARFFPLVLHTVTVLTMHLTSTETAVINCLRSLTTATMATMCQHLEVSRMTVARALSKHGYFSSFNHNSSFYAAIPDALKNL
jgi:hypothetical protein